VSAKVITFLVDECLGKPAVEHLTATLTARYRQSKIAHSFRFASIADIVRLGTPDAQWIPRVEKRGYIIITSDRGRRGKPSKGEKLPLLCRRHGITYVMLSNALHHSNTQAKTAAIEQMFEELLGLAKARRGSGFWLGRERGRLKLINQDVRSRRRRRPRPRS
jgi:hypothetical protein